MTRTPSGIKIIKVRPQVWELSRLCPETSRNCTFMNSALVWVMQHVQLYILRYIYVSSTVNKRLYRPVGKYLKRRRRIVGREVLCNPTLITHITSSVYRILVYVQYYHALPCDKLQKNRNMYVKFIFSKYSTVF